MKQNVSDTLTFLHQERNDFLPEDDIIIPSRKDDHVSYKIDLECINLKNKKPDIREEVEEQVDEVIKTAEEVVNEIKQNELLERRDDFQNGLDSIAESLANVTDDTFNNLDSLKDDSITKAQERSEEAFKFLENEASSPIVSMAPSFEETAMFVQKEKELYSPELPPRKAVSFNDDDEAKKSAIPVSKSQRKNEKEKDIDLLFATSEERESISPTDGDLLSKIPVSAKGKVKTIKKHSKDPLKEFVKLAQDVNWDEDDVESFTIKTTTTTQHAEPIVKTTVTRITSDGVPVEINSKVTLNDENKSKIPVLQNAQHPTDLTIETVETTVKSKIPILVTETTRIVSPEKTIQSPESRVSTLDSDSDESRRSPPLRGILKKTSGRTVGSSSGSDVALHEAGAELSEDDSGRWLV